MPVTAATPDPAPEIPVHLVQMWLCEPCLDGEGEECHTPGCSLWIHTVPKPALRGSQGVTVLGDAVEPFTARWEDMTPGQAAHAEHQRRFDGLAVEDWFTDLAESERADWEAIAARGHAAFAGPGRDEDEFAADRPDRHADLDAGEFGGAMTDADFYDVTEAQHARDMAAEDGDTDWCQPTL